MESGPRTLKSDLINLEDYHRRLTQLLERIEQLEESLKSLPLASCKYKNDDDNVNELAEQELEDDKQDLKSVELDKDKSLKEEEKKKNNAK